jgi:hypothetical protein
MSAPAGFKPVASAPSGTYVDLWVPGRGVLPRCMLWIEQWHEIGPDGVGGERVRPEPTHWRETLEDAVPPSGARQ